MKHIKNFKDYNDILKGETIELNENELKSKSDKGNRYFKMLSTGKFQHYDSPKGELSKFTSDDDRKRIVSKLSKKDKQTYREWLKTEEGEESLNNFKPTSETLIHYQ